MQHKNIFDRLSDSIIQTLTYVIHNCSGFLQVVVYLVMGTVFLFALRKAFQSIRALAHRDLKGGKGILHSGESGDIGTPLSFIAATFFYKAKKHYIDEQNNGDYSRIVPPDAFLRDAAFQYSERYFEEKFLDPMGMLANLMPPMGFIGTIIGMVVHFLSNSGSLNNELTIGGIATALYTTFIGLVCYTFLEVLRKIFYALAHRRIEEGLTAISGAYQQASTGRTDR